MISRQAAWEAFEASFPLVNHGALEERMERGFELYRSGALKPIPGCSPWAWTVDCQQPEKKRPDEPLRYTAVIAGAPTEDWRCDCGDSVWRRRICKHALAAWLVATFGPAPEPGTVRIVATVDAEFEAFLDALADEAGQEPPDDADDWAIADWADDDLELPEYTLGDVPGYAYRR